MHRLEVAHWRAEEADVVVADPARPGLGRSATTALAATEAPVFILVSCDPASAARDARLLANHGYRHDKAVVLDLFPDTPHLEVVTRFVR
jgi:23S rRNA (uracil1939-C5)-methyltransferase